MYERHFKEGTLINIARHTVTIKSYLRVKDMEYFENGQLTGYV